MNAPTDPPLPGRPKAEEWDWDAGIDAVGLSRCERTSRVHSARHTMMHPLHDFCSNVIADTRNSGQDGAGSQLKKHVGHSQSFIAWPYGRQSRFAR